MLPLLRALHVHAAKRGDGLLPKLLTMSPWPHEQPMNENSAAAMQVAKSEPDKPAAGVIFLTDGEAVDGGGAGVRLRKL